MTENENFMIEAALQVGFDIANDEATEFRCTQEQIVDLMTRARRAGQKDREMVSLVSEMRAGPLRMEAARYNPTGNITFSMVFDNDLMASMGQSSAVLFASFVREALSIDHKPDGRELLEKSAWTFRFYEGNHRKKVSTLTDEAAIADALAKAECNAEMAARIEEFLKDGN